ncbi:glutathione S-transferase [Thiomicrorhabdus indica]|uniref:glutathione S-transferase n=1 Tax=Thiomicrorhabdus indica TaxID=2267253 RepID=UPI0019816934|nr:glutathione S-transferase [Thiomicrorhabdus indica]
MIYPILYSYRRCPYAMRSRLAIYFSGVKVEQREIVFWDKPEPMLQASPKGTVPVLVLPESENLPAGKVIDESWEIMQWALRESDLLPAGQKDQINHWLQQNDFEFKGHLDAYKYPDDFPEIENKQARQKGEVFLQKLELALQSSSYLLGEELSVVDLAIFPFIRQFAHVDKIWWQSANYPALKTWLNKHLESDYFKAVMKNRPVWQKGHSALLVHEPELQTKDQFRKKAEA